ncbi:MAG: alginate lyase family protein, partial [Armatimonadota bacterium]
MSSDTRLPGVSLPKKEAATSVPRTTKRIAILNPHPRRRRRLLSSALVVAASLLPFAAAYPVVPAAQEAPAPSPKYPKPDPAKKFAGLKIYQPNGSPLRLPKDDWDGARKRLAASPDLQKWVATQRADTDDWMAKRRDRVEWICGWYHDFVSPKDGSHLTFTPDEPGENTLSSPSDPSVKLTPKLHAAWVFAFRTRHVRQIEQAAKLYRLTGERKYADWAAGQIDFYSDNYARWPKQSDREGTHFMWQSLDEAVNLVSFAKAARDLGDFATPERKQKWFTHLFEPEAALLNSSRLTIHNIACWHRSAVGCVAVLYKNEDLWKSAVEGPFGIKAQMAKGVTSDYLWEEQSLHYNTFVVSALLPFFEFAAVQGEGAKLTHEMETAENLMLAPIAMRFPTGLLPSPADGNAPFSVPNVNFLADAARLFPTSVGLAAARTRKDWNALLDPLPAPANANPVLPAAESLNM